ncbi:MAG: multidrug efflux SMR transporter [Anaerolineae bacterium]|nr:multidrug efflux SMR transporter [Anaerolineae bacterium]
MNGFAYLGIAILAEIIATNSLKLSNGFTQLIPSIVVVIGYAVAFYFLSLALREIPLGISYAIWSAIGTVGTVLIGIVVWKQPVNVPTILGIALIVAGVIMLNVFGEGVHTA